MRLRCLAAGLLIASSIAGAQTTTHNPPAILIKGGQLVDGTGSSPRKADLLIENGIITKIAATFDATEMGNTMTIDATGKVVAPGFIDTHAHGDPRDEAAAFENFLAQGVTTICLGQDGSSVRVAEMEKWMRSIDENPTGPNIVLFVGQGTIRDESGTKLSENPTPEQLTTMRNLSEQAMKMGCFGMTTGLEYQPGLFAKAEELRMVAEPVGAHGGLVMSHLRTEDDDQLFAAMRELFDQGRAAKVPVHVSHLKSVYGKGAPRAEEILAFMDKARANGDRITADVYPYEASFTGLAILFPAWALPPNKYDEVVATKRDELAQYLRNRITKRNGPAATLFGTGGDAGKTLEQVAKETGKPFEDVLIEKGPDGGSAAYFIMDEALRQRLMADPHVNICSDGSPTMRHPRGYGSFAKVIREQVTDRKTMTLEQAVHKMSGLAAETIGLTAQKRGELKEGWAADVVIFDPPKVKDTATFENPKQLAEGFDIVIINGQITRQDGKMAGKLNGRMLRKR
ncbi:amidohydrolase family protein [Candidatus Sumerlaeota bacterium]|nr:amidohydrolase family protein [Candidatus Sumerlaeota bacterium]